VARCSKPGKGLRATDPLICYKQIKYCYLRMVKPRVAFWSNRMDIKNKIPLALAVYVSSYCTAQLIFSIYHINISDYLDILFPIPIYEFIKFIFFSYCTRIAIYNIIFDISLIFIITFASWYLGKWFVRFNIKISIPIYIITSIIIHTFLGVYSFHLIFGK